VVAVGGHVNTLTEKGRDALAEWVRTPASLPRIQNEPVVRLLAADLVDRAAVRDGLQAMRDDIEAGLAAVAEGREAAKDFPDRLALLTVNHDYAERYLRLQQEWLDAAERVLRGTG
jgi:hypothetical protein